MIAPAPAPVKRKPPKPKPKHGIGGQMSEKQYQFYLRRKARYGKGAIFGMTLR